MRKRPLELKFRLSQDEYNLLQRQLAEAGMNRNAYLVRLITGATIFPKDQIAYYRNRRRAQWGFALFVAAAFSILQ